MSNHFDSELREDILEIVDNQVINNDPPETRQTLERLISAGSSKKEARELIGAVVIAEIYQIKITGKKFNLSRYAAALNKLPELPETPEQTH